MSNMSIIGPSTSAEEMDTQTFDVTVDDVVKYNVGDEVTITIKGCVGMVSIPRDSMFGGEPNIGVKIYSQDIRKTGNAQIEEIRKMVEGDISGDDGEGNM